MKKIIAIASALFLSLGALAQSTQEEFATRYLMLVNKLGYDGVGIETLIKKWEAAFPDDPDMLGAKFSYYFTKSQSHSVVAKDKEKYLGLDPVLTLKDSTGTNVYYYDETFYDDDMFALASTSIDKAIRLRENDISLRLSKIRSLIAYEKESPDMATLALNSLIDYNCISHPKWTWGNEAFSQDNFIAQVLDCSFVLFRNGSKASYDAFRAISEKLLSYYPKNTDVLNNLGSYYFVAEKDYKTARKYYEKTLKLDPSNYAAVKNCVILGRRMGNTKLESKYLAKLMTVSPDERERESARIRLESFKKK